MDLKLLLKNANVFNTGNGRFDININVFIENGVRTSDTRGVRRKRLGAEGGIINFSLSGTRLARWVLAEPLLNTFNR